MKLNPGKFGLGVDYLDECAPSRWTPCGCSVLRTGGVSDPTWSAIGNVALTMHYMTVTKTNYTYNVVHTVDVPLCSTVASSSALRTTLWMKRLLSNETVGHNRHVMYPTTGTFKIRSKSKAIGTNNISGGECMYWLDTFMSNGREQWIGACGEQMAAVILTYGTSFDAVAGVVIGARNRWELTVRWGDVAEFVT